MPHDRRQFPEQVTTQVLDAHPCPLYASAGDAFEVGLTVVTTDPPVLRASGALDLTNAAAFDRALTTLAASGQDVTVDLAAVDFIDLAATRALVLAAQAMSGHQRLVVTSPPPVMSMILQTCWHETQVMRLTVRERPAS